MSDAPWAADRRNKSKTVAPKGKAILATQKRAKLVLSEPVSRRVFIHLLNRGCSFSQ